MCLNAVLEVHYKIKWNGNNVTKVVADILLGNITLPNNTVRRKTNGNYETFKS